MVCSVNFWRAGAINYKHEKYLLKLLGDLQLMIIIESGSNSVFYVVLIMFGFCTVNWPTDGQSES